MEGNLFKKCLLFPILLRIGNAGDAAVQHMGQDRPDILRLQLHGIIKEEDTPVILGKNEYLFKIAGQAALSFPGPGRG